MGIDGEITAESDGHHHGGRERNRWHDVTIYRLADGRFAIAITYRTRWQGELDHHAVFVVAGPADVARTLRDYDPAGRVAGYPPGGQYQERQDRLLRDVRSRYEDQVTDVLDADEFAVDAANESNP